MSRDEAIGPVAETLLGNGEDHDVYSVRESQPVVFAEAKMEGDALMIHEIWEGAHESVRPYP